MTSPVGPTLSVCIPTCNAAEHIRATIASVLAAADPSDEILVQDDASDDDTAARVDAIGDPRILVDVNPRRVGVPANWNRAFERASGELIAMLNHDDLVRPFWLTFARRALARNPSAAWVTTAFDVLNADGQPVGRIQRFPETGVYPPSQVLPVVARLDGLGPFVVVRRHAVRTLGGYDEMAGPGADNELYLRLAARHDMVYSATPHAAWRVHSGNLSHRWAPVDQAREGFRMLTRLFEDPSLDPELAALGPEALSFYLEKTQRHLDRLRRGGATGRAGELERFLASREAAR